MVFVDACFFAADIGAKTYANSVPEHDFSTQEVVLSMLQHDTRFRQLLAARANTANLDLIELECVIADSYRNAQAYDELFTSCSEAYKPASGKSAREAVSVEMTIPGNYGKIYQIALDTLYQYWGIPCSPAVYRNKKLGSVFCVS